MISSSRVSPLHLDILSNASATSLFDAWTMPAVAELWLFQDAAHEVEFVADVREGGQFHTVEKNGAHAVSHRGTFLTLERPRKIVFALEVPDHFEGVSEVTVEIREEPNGCHVSFSQANVDTSKNEAPWRSMLVDLDQLLKTPYTVNEASSTKELVRAVHVATAQLVGFIDALDDQRLNAVPYKNSWTAAQLVSHVMASTSGMAKALALPGKSTDREATQRVIELKQSFLDLTKSMQSPDEIVPERRAYARAELLAGIQRCLKSLKEAARAVNPAELVDGLPLGAITKLEILHFVLYHTQRHVSQMRKIVDVQS